jgi:O-antigen/teichoic acid export membrane protein
MFGEVVIANENKSLMRNSLYSLGTSVALILVSFFISILQARVLGPEGKGGYDLFVATGGLLIMLFGFSLPSGITYVVALSKVSLSAMIRRLLLIVFGQCLLVLSLLRIAERGGWIWTFLPRGEESVILLIAGYMFLNVLNGYWRAILIGRQEIIAANRFSLLARLAEVLLFLLLLGMLRFIGHPLDLFMVIEILVASAFILNIFFLRRLRILLRLPSQGLSGLREILDYSLPCYLGNVVQFLNYRLDMFLVSALIDQRAVGLYALSVSLAQLVWLLSNSISTVLLPKVASEQHLAARNAQLSARATRLSLWVSLMAGLSLCLAGVVMVPVIYGEAFRYSITPLLFLMPGVVAIGPAFILASYIAGIGKPRINLFVALIGLFFTIILDLLLIPRLNITGAALASTVSYSIIAVLTVWFFKRETKIPLRDVFLITKGDIRLMISVRAIFWKGAF